MRFLGWAELDAAAEALDEAARQTPEIDGFCSASAWVLPARAAFLPDALPAALIGDEGAITLALRRSDVGVLYACPLEAVWGLASPLLGRDPEPLVERALDLLHSGTPHGTPRALVMPGVANAGRAAKALARAAKAHRVRLSEGPETARVVASLAGGVDGFWSRRSAKFRATTRRARRHAAARGTTYERIAEVSPEALPTLWAQILAIEAQSRKAAMGGGLSVPEMQTFYRDMLPRLARQGALRAVIARQGDAAIAYVLGGLFRGPTGVEYRGLQVSFDDRHAADSPGVCVHVEMIEWLAESGVGVYDLGSDMPYKHRWGEPGLTTRLFVVSG